MMEGISMSNKGLAVLTHENEDYIINDPNIADEFSTSKAYAAGERCYYQGNLYRFTSAHSAGAWNSSHVILDKIAADIEKLEKGGKILSGISMTAAQVIKVADGAVQYLSSSVTNWACSDYIEIPAGTKVIKTNADASGNSAKTWGNAFYDAGQNFITNSGTLEQVMEVPENAAYIRVTTSNDSGVFNIYLNFENILGEMASDVNYLIDGEETIENIKMTPNGAINAETGAVSSFPGYPHWKYSDFIKIPECTAFFKTNATSEGSSLGVAFYDENKLFIEGSGVPGYSNAVNTFVIHDNYKYMRFTDGNTEDPAIYITWICKTNNVGLYAETEDFAEAVASEKMLTGNYILDSVITLQEGQTVIGSRCTVNVTGNGQIMMKKRSRISGIKFVGDWEPERTEGDETHPSMHG